MIQLVRISVPSQKEPLIAFFNREERRFLEFQNTHAWPSVKKFTADYNDEGRRCFRQSLDLVYPLLPLLRLVTPGK